LKGFGLSLVIAGVCGYAAALNKTVRRFIEPLEVIIKTIPNLSYIMVFLIWLGSEGSVMVTSFCVLFPVFYTAILLSQDLLDSELQDVLRCYPETPWIVFWKIRLPQALPHLAARKTGFGRPAGLCDGSAYSGAGWHWPADVMRRGWR
ncbi:MAG: ABC transporter permease, partial [Holdemania massiliensis]